MCSGLHEAPVNRRVVGSSPTSGAINIIRIMKLQRPPKGWPFSLWASGCFGGCWVLRHLKPLCLMASSRDAHPLARFAHGSPRPPACPWSRIPPNQRHSHSVPARQKSPAAVPWLNARHANRDRSDIDMRSMRRIPMLASTAYGYPPHRALQRSGRRRVRIIRDRLQSPAIPCRVAQREFRCSWR
jgi:hypothetical protein